MSRIFACLLFVGLSAAAAQAQFRPYDPYAPQVEEPPISSDGKVNWPSFYASAQTEQRYRDLWNSGSCGGSRKDLLAYFQSNKLDINKLGEGSIQGKAMQGDQSGVVVATGDNKLQSIVIHPAGVTKVSVTGSMRLADLRPGMIVRCLTKIDSTGRGQTPIESLEVFTPSGPESLVAVTPNEDRTVSGRVVSLRGERLQLHVEAGTIHKVALPVNDKTQVRVSGSSLALVGPGDEVEAKGRMMGAVKNNLPTIFASEVTVVKKSIGGVATK